MIILHMEIYQMNPVSLSSLCPSRQWLETSKGKNAPVQPWNLHFAFVSSPVLVVYLLSVI